MLTGGDPIKRPDLFELIGYARRVGVRVSLTPSATPLLTREVVGHLKDAGLARLAVSMDGASAETHDVFRGMAGSFARTSGPGPEGSKAVVYTRLSFQFTSEELVMLVRSATDVLRNTGCPW